MDAFLSYSAKDQDVASRLAKDLAAAGVEVSTASQDIKPGENWVQAIVNQIRNAPNFVFLISNNSLSSAYVSTELATALAASEASPDRRVIPLIIDKHAEIPAFLRQIQALDISTPQKYEAGIQVLSKLFTRSQTEKYTGPYPDPSLLALYEKIGFGTAEEIMKMAERQQFEYLTSLERDRQAYLRGRVFGVLAFSLAIAIIISAFTWGKAASADIAALGTAILGLIASFAAGFATGRRPRALRSASDREATHGD